MFDKMILGRYIQLDSPMHRLDPRTKLLGSLFFIMMIFLADHWIAYAILAILVTMAVYLSRIDVKFFIDGLKPMIGLILFTVIFQLFFTGGGDVFFKWGILQVTSLGIINSVFMFVRLVLIIMASTILTLTTAPLELTDGIEHLLRPLAKFGFPSHEIALMLSIALRYVPTLMDEAEKIMNAQRARGVEFDQGSFLDRVKAMVPILVPLFVSAFNRAEEMAIAMEARGYQGGEGRTKYRQLSYSKEDVIFVCVLIIVTIILIAIKFYL